MTRYAALVCLILALGGCEKGSAKALREAELVEKSGDQEAICRAKIKVADEFLHEEDQDGYRLYKAGADSYCMSTQLRRANGG